MARALHRKDSMYFQLLRLLIISAVVAGVNFLILDQVVGYVIDSYYYSLDYQKQKGEEYANKLQGYVNKNQLSSKDTKALTSWVKKQNIILVDIYKDDILVFSSEYPDEAIWEEEISANNYEWETYYTITFADGEAEVVVSGLYGYRAENYALIIELVVSFILFLLLVFVGIRKKMNYILQLGNEIEILEGGRLDYSVTIKGKDELAVLAEGLDAMRISFGEMIERETRIVRENQKIVTEMSHDLRTPVTSILLYTELLKKEKYKDEDQLKEYIEKIEQKTYRMKQLTDHLFEYSLVTGNDEIRLESPEFFEVIFYDLFSEMCSYLQSKGFAVDFNIEWIEKKIQIYTPYVMRIMDNISSNIIKYADIEKPIVMRLLDDNRGIGFSVENEIKFQSERVESTQVGIQSINSMMKKMGGVCEIKKTAKSFAIELSFPI